MVTASSAPCLHQFGHFLLSSIQPVVQFFVLILQPFIFYAHQFFIRGTNEPECDEGNDGGSYKCGGNKTKNAEEFHPQWRFQFFIPERIGIIIILYFFHTSYLVTFLVQG